MIKEEDYLNDIKTEISSSTGTENSRDQYVE
jgi:hypothetical protein